MPLTREEEKKLVQRSQKGDSDAMGILYESFQLELLRSGMLLLKNEEDAMDIVSETFVLFFKSIDKFDVKYPVRPWLHRILRNQASTFFQKRTRNYQQMEELQQNTEMFEPNQEESVFSNEEAIFLQKAMIELSEGDREVLESFYYQDLSVKEIAGTLGVPEGTVKSRLFKARNILSSKIRELFDNRCKEEEDE